MFRIGPKEAGILTSCSKLSLGLTGIAKYKIAYNIMYFKQQITIIYTVRSNDNFVRDTGAYNSRLFVT
jgi:hypothetical protein